jgi:hypothetical protein
MYSSSRHGLPESTLCDRAVPTTENDDCGGNEKSNPEWPCSDTRGKSMFAMLHCRWVLPCNIKQEQSK